MLRERLQDLTKNAAVEEHPQMLVSLRNEIPHSIRVMDSEFPIDSYTCFPYVFDLIGEPDYIEISKLGIGRVFANSEFVAYLLDTNSLYEIKPEDINSNDIVLYFDQGKPTHAGRIVANKRVISKWGTGHLYEHDLLDIPESYGNEVRFYKRIDKETALELFLDYAEFQEIIKRQ